MTPEELIIHISLVGQQEVIAGLDATTAATGELTAATDASGVSIGRTAKRGYLMNQALFTMRRFLYLGTLAVGGLGLEAIRMGFNFDRGMQTARVAMQGFLPSTQAINTELNKLYNFAAYTPFQFQDIVLATRRLIPFTNGVAGANQLVSSLVNSLSAMGITTVAALNRATVAWAHLLSAGRVTGLALTQMLRDNIPILQALAAHFHTTTEEIRTMVKSGLIPSTVAVQAFNDYVRKTPGYAGAAMRLATRSLTGAWTTFKDIIMKSFGTAESGFFGFLQRTLSGIDKTLAPLMQAGKPITLTDLAEAFDKQLSPKTHAIINLFNLLRSTLSGLWFWFRSLTTVVRLVLLPFVTLANWVGKLTGSDGGGMRALGFALATVITMLTLYRTGVLLALAATQVAAVATRLWTVAMYAAYLAIRLVTVGLALFDAALLANPIGLVVAAVALLVAGLVILYFKWKAFHDLVVNVFNWIRSHWPLLLGILGGPFALAAVAIIQHFTTIKKFIEGLINWITSKFTSLGKTLHSFWSHVPGHAFLGTAAHSVTSIVHAFATGGVMPSTGLALVGESGPELVTLPGGSTITPMWPPAQAAVSSLDDFLSAKLNDLKLYATIVMPNGDVLAKTVAQAVTNSEARL